MPVLTKGQTTANVRAFESTPTSFVLKQSAWLWSLPIVLMCLWLSIPLSVGDGKTNLGLFLFWRALYHQGTCGFVISLSCIAMPTPSILSQVLLCAVAVTASLLLDYVFSMEEDGELKSQLFKLTPILTNCIVMIGIYFATKAAFARELTTYLHMTRENSSRRELPQLRPSFVEFEEHRSVTELTPSPTGPVVSQFALSRAGETGSASFLSWDEQNKTIVPSDASERGTGQSDPNSLQAKINARKYTATEAETIMERALQSDVTLLRRDKDGNLFLMYYSQHDLKKSWVWRCIYTVPIFAAYCVCVYYGPLTKDFLSSDVAQAFSVLLFAVALFPLRLLLNQVGKRIDQSLERVQGLPKFVHVGAWICLCFEHFFVRQLFFRITKLEIVVVVVCINLAKNFCLFPLRMSDTYMNFKSWAAHKPRPTDEERKAVRMNETVIFYFVCMAERMSITLLLLCATILHFCDYNGRFFRDTSKYDDYPRLIEYCIYMLAVEWTGSTIMTIVLMKRYGLNALTFGGHVVCNPHVKVCCIYIAVHIASDYYAGNCLTAF